MKQSSTFILKAVIVLIALAGLAFGAVFLPQAIQAEMAGDFDYLPVLVGMYVPAGPFFFALSQAFALLNLIDRNQAFSEKSVKALQRIKFSAFTISALYAAGMPYIFYLGDRDDAPGLVALGFVIVGATFVVGTAAAVFQSLVQNAVDIKSENDLTV